ncbi:hypothetical protein PCANC_22673 [Puccinia coronata f. sp. avenae]|uniref:Uncharacterized protein n=1 Tax=Puccinia coronata f. sp. avenae TaxID=200324 RepID=A0A2N5TVM0_9BASI|nr:hypothetical protein PCANC_22673 [Puccinia coronata f. sp. avenae]
MALALLTGLQPANRPTSAFPGPNLPAPAHGSQTLLPSSRQPLSTLPRKSPHDHQHVQCHAPEVLHPTQHGFQMRAQQKSQQLFQLQQMQPKQQQLQENRKIQAQQHAASQRSQNGLGMTSQLAPGLLPAASIELVPRAHDGCREIQPDFSQIISQQQPSNQLSLNLSSHSDCSRGHAEDAFDLTMFVNKIHLVGLELVILLHPLVSCPIFLPIVKDAVQILRDSIGVALHSLAVLINPSGASSDTTSSASEEQMPELTPIQLSKLLFIIISDTPITFTEEGKETKLLWTPTVQPATVQAIVSWVGQELISQIANHQIL